MARCHSFSGLTMLAAGVLLATICARTPLLAASRVSDNTHKLAAGDRVGIKVFDDDQLSGSYSIDAAGMVTMPIIGEIMLSGLSLEETQKALESKLKEGYYTRPTVSVRVEEYRAVYVHGQVKNPGAYPYRVGLTPVGAMVIAGGAPNPLASTLAITADLNAAEERVNVQRQRMLQLQVRIAALEAERNNSRTLEKTKLPPDVADQPGIEHLVAIEQRQLDTELSSLDNETSVLEKQRPQFQSEVEAIEIELAAQTKLLALARERQTEVAELLKKGLSRRVAMIEPAQQMAMAETQLARLRSAKSRNEIERGALELKIVEKQNQFKQRALSQLADAQRALSDATIQLRHATTVRDLRRQAMGAGTLALAPVFIITRMTADQPRVFEAQISTPVEPGDIIEVRTTSSVVPEAALTGPDLLPKRAEEPTEPAKLKKQTQLRKRPALPHVPAVRHAALHPSRAARAPRSSRATAVVVARQKPAHNALLRVATIGGK